MNTNCGCTLLGSLWYRDDQSLCTCNTLLLMLARKISKQRKMYILGNRFCNCFRGTFHALREPLWDWKNRGEGPKQNRLPRAVGRAKWLKFQLELSRVRVWGEYIERNCVFKCSVPVPVACRLRAEIEHDKLEIAGILYSLVPGLARQTRCHLESWDSSAGRQLWTILTAGRERLTNPSWPYCLCRSGVGTHPMNNFAL